jgi:hypothetical protein
MEEKKKLTPEELKKVRQENYKKMIQKKYKDRYLFDDKNSVINIDGPIFKQSTRSDKEIPKDGANG